MSRFPKTHREVVAFYAEIQAMATPTPVIVSGAEDPQTCRDCTRKIVWATDWKGANRPILAYPRPSDKLGWIETALGHFEPAYVHRCSKDETDELDDSEINKAEEAFWQERRKKARWKAGLDAKPKRGQMKLKLD